jgi:hypothetical protein
MAKSIYLSTGRFAGAEGDPSWPSELERLQAELHAGKSIMYEEAEIERILASKKMLLQIPRNAPWIMLLKFFFPGLLVLGLIWLFVWILRLITSG